MKKRIVWPERHYSQRSDPFTGADPLRITLHSESFDRLSTEEQKAIDLIRGFSRLDQFEVFGFSEPDLLISFRKHEGTKSFGLKVVEKSGHESFRSGFSEDRVNLKYINRNTTQILKSEDDSPQRNELMCVEAHIAAKNHLFVTASEFLLDPEFEGIFDPANICSPIQALKIAALLLRSKGQWLYAYNYSSSSSMFYSNLLFSRIQHRRFSTENEDDRVEASNQLISFYEKCRRALRTRDTLGGLFYKSQDFETLDSQLYYFDYLTLLLAGAFDSLAEIANVLFSLEYGGLISFRNRHKTNSFIKMLEKSGANGLVRAVTGERGTKLQTMLFGLRNQIHGVLPSGVTAKNFDRQDESYIKVDDKIRDQIFETSGFFPAQENWGLAKRKFMIDSGGLLVPNYEVKLEPFNYATQLVDTWLSFFEEILSSLPDSEVLQSNERDKSLEEIASLLG